MRLIVILLVTVILCSCSSDERAVSDHKQEGSAQSGQPRIQKKVAITIIEENKVSNLKRALTIRLDERVSKEVLADIAMQIRNSDSRAYERTFIEYYLPGMEVGAGAWATTHFMPELDTRILGLTIEEEQALKSIPIDSSQETLGVWIEELIKRRTTIFKKENKLFVSHFYTDGSSDTEEVVERQSHEGRSFHSVENQDERDYYFLDEKGDLYAGNGTDSILMGKRIK